MLIHIFRYLNKDLYFKNPLTSLLIAPKNMKLKLKLKILINIERHIIT